MQKKKYTRGEFAQRVVPPPVDPSLDQAFILDLPDDEIDEYLWRKLDLKNMPTDEDLINYMEDLIDDH